MAAANLIVRLLMEMGVFDKNIKTAQKQMQSLEKTGKNVASKFGQIATVFGVATTAYEIFMTAVNSSVSTTKAFQTAVDVAATSVDSFFYSLTTGNFSTFRMGMDVVIAKAREAKEALLDVQYSQMAGNYKVSELRAEYDTYAQKAKDPRLSKEDRQLYAQKQEEIIIKLEDYTNNQIEMLTNAILHSSTSGIMFSKDDVSLQMIEELLTKVALGGRSGVLNEYGDKIKEYENVLKELGGVKFTREEWDEFLDALIKYTGGLGSDKVIGVVNAAIQGTGLESMSGRVDNYIYELFAAKKISQGQLESINKITQEYLPYVLGESFLNNKSPEELQTLIGFMQQIGALKSQLAQWKQGTNENAALFTTTTSSGSGGKETYLPDSVLGLKQAISDAEKVRDTIDAVHDPFGFIVANMEVEKLKTRLQQVMALLPSDEKLELPDFSDESWYEPMEFEIKEITQQTEDWGSSLNNIVTIMSSISNMTNDGAAAWLVWGANALSAIAAAIPAMQELFTLNAANATAEAASSAAKTPVIGVFAALAAIAAMTAAFASLPKYANGGIVGSPFGSGDRVLARVNGGEMILNKQQQTHLFNLLDNGVALSGNGGVKFRIEGKDLVGVLDNYNNRMNKLR